MFEIITCPESQEPAKVYTHSGVFGGRRVVFCSLWEREGAMRECAEGCMRLLERSRNAAGK